MYARVYFSTLDAAANHDPCGGEEESCCVLPGTRPSPMSHSTTSTTTASPQSYPIHDVLTGVFMQQLVLS